MNVLLQGDVGAGKTLVALHAALVAIGSGHQATIMAPTEVLAGQHFRTWPPCSSRSGGRAVDLRGRPTAAAAQGSAAPAGPGPRRSDPVTEGRPVTYAMLSAAVTGKGGRGSLDGVAEGEVDLVVGTHALVQEGVAFADLSLAVVDEQHRFGLHQRVALKGKGGDPDVLIMTATPIPRTLALTYYGDLDVGVLDELPRAGGPSETTRPGARPNGPGLRPGPRRGRSGRQAFVVCAAIDEGNRRQVRAAEAEAERLPPRCSPTCASTSCTGGCAPKEKEAVMERFRAGEADLLIATTVIEVGVDMPNATVMLVENAERFGLAQLHQLRGRIGRGAHASYCVLFDESGRKRGGARAPRRHGADHRWVRAGRRGPPAPGGGDAVRHQAGRDAGPEAGEAGRGRRRW